MKPRYPFLDNLKAIGIVLVVLGHAPGIPATVNTLIFGFHVPLFFFAAGFVVALRPEHAPVQATLAELRRFLLPYGAFFLLSYLYWLPARGMGNSAATYAGLPWWDPFVSFAAGYGSYVNPTLWFFPCIAATAVLHLWARRHVSAPILPMLCTLAAMGVALLWQASGPVLPFRLDTAAVALAFYGIGHWCGERRLFGLAERPPAQLRLWAVALCAAYVALSLRNPAVDLANMVFGVNPELYLPTALVGIAACLLVSLCFRDDPVTRWLAAHTLYIFPLHWLLFRVFTGVGILAFGLPRDFKDQSPLIGLAYVLLALLLCWPLAALATRLTRGRTARALPAAP